MGCSAGTRTSPKISVTRRAALFRRNVAEPGLNWAIGSALTGASSEMPRPAHRLLIFASVATLVLNVAEPLVAGEFGKAAFDAVEPLLLLAGRRSDLAYRKRLAQPVVFRSHTRLIDPLYMWTQTMVRRRRSPNLTM
jgi:hypothetical protein